MTSQRSIGYARIHDEPGDFHGQVAGLAELGVRAEEMFWDRCASAREGLIGAVLRCEPGDTLTVTALDRLATSLEDLEDLTPMLIDREIRLNIGGVVFDPVNEVGRSVFDTFRLAARFQAGVERRRERDTIATYMRVRAAFSSAHTD
ncbi:recombinase family protein [Nonomuraea sp. NPDC050451]|uniref:recombinase family protein n=1 Tax=Nonomuraea sp. NPDC050451 TaxID=3364364 RepID=UPI0037B72D7E